MSQTEKEITVPAAQKFEALLCEALEAADKIRNDIASQPPELRTPSARVCVAVLDDALLHFTRGVCGVRSELAREGAS